MVKKNFPLILLLCLAFPISTITTRPICAETGYSFDDDSTKKGRKKKKKKKSRKGKRTRKKKDKTVFPKGPHEKTFQKQLGEEYKTRYTDHFVVLYNGDEQVVKDFILRIEQTYKSVDRFVQKMGIRIDYPKEKLIVLFCPNYEECNRLCKQFVGRGAPQRAAGLYWSGINFSIFYDMSQSRSMKDFAAKIKRLKEEARNAKDRNQKKAKAKEAQWYVNRSKVYQQNNNRSVVQHEVAHHLLYNLQVHQLGSRNPQWFVEGLATLFEPPPGKSGAGFYIINQRRLGDVREKLKEETPESLRAFVGAGADRSGMLSSEDYARSWALAYYLLKRKQKQLPKYVEMVKKRSRRDTMTEADAIKDFEKAFGTIDRKFVNRWLKYIDKLPYAPSQ
ncbi:MAG: DUF1570 domain-containing protein [Phycisphaerales bacterium]|nr:DUF1570 domain-containing protein [Phycisphaerales bacterium]